MLNTLFGAFVDVTSKLQRKDCDNFDRLSNCYTMAFLVTSTVFLATKSFMSDSIDCFSPAEFDLEDDDTDDGHPNWIKYTDNYCWVKNTYYVPMTASLPGPVPGAHPEASGGEAIKYYQWVPIIIAFMLFVFSLPVRFWDVAVWTSGYDIRKQIELCSTDANIEPEKRDKTTTYIVAQMYRHITYDKKVVGLNRRIDIASRYGNYLFIMCMITKLLYTAVPITLICLLTVAMGPGYYDYGIRVVKGVIDGSGAGTENPMFPKVAYCDFAIRGVGQNIRRYTVQCVLPVNLFNDKLFLIFWWWFVTLACLSLVGLVYLLVRNCRPGGGVAYVEKYLHNMKVADADSKDDDEYIKLFTEKFLKLDGVFCMRLIAANTRDLVTGEIMSKLYIKWRDEEGSMYKDS